MTFLPIVERELRSGSRKAAPRYIRLAVAAVALLIGLFQILLIPAFSRGVTGGGTAFGIMTGYAFLLCVIAGIFVTADCLSEEKRAGTLGLLFLTDLRGYDVVLGKLASQLIYLGYALLALIPGAALPLLLGGITGGEVWRISLALINLLCFSLAAGIFASSVCREAGYAMTLTAGLQLAFCLGVPLLQWASNVPGSGPTALWAGWASPTLAYVAAVDTEYTPAPSRFWLALLGSHSVAWLLILAAARILPRSWQERAITAPLEPTHPQPLQGGEPGQTRPQTSSPPGRGQGWVYPPDTRAHPDAYDAPTPAIPSVPEPGTAEPDFAYRSKRKRKLLDEDPILWLIGERKGLQSGLWALSLVWGAAAVLVVLTAASEALLAVAVIGWIGLLITKILFTVEACRFFTETRRAGSFELLLATPINANRFVSAQWTALRRLFGPPLLTVAGATLLVLVLSAVIYGTRWEETFTITAIGGTVTVLALAVEMLDFLALGWLGMWLALTMRKPQLASGATILYVLILPGLTMVATFCFFFVGFILDIVLIAVFASKLNAEFRQTLTNPKVAAALEQR